MATASPLEVATVGSKQKCSPKHQQKVRRFSEFCLQFDSPVVPDPYCGGVEGFEQVLDLVEDASEGLLRHVRAQVT